MFTNDDPHVSTVTSNRRFQQAVRYALDYAGILSVAGPGAVQVPGIIPSMILGALPQEDAIKQDLAKATADLAASGVGNQRVTLEYPTDLTINGVPFTTLAEKVQATLRRAGFNIALGGSPVATFQPKFRAGQVAFGLWLWAPDYPDPADYLAFTPGRLVALHVGWPAGSDPPIEQARREGTRRDGAGHSKVDLSADPAGAERAQPVHPTDPAHAGIRGDDRSCARVLQRRLRRRRHAHLSEVTGAERAVHLGEPLFRGGCSPSGQRVSVGRPRDVVCGWQLIRCGEVGR